MDFSLWITTLLLVYNNCLTISSALSPNAQTKCSEIHNLSICQLDVGSPINFQCQRSLESIEINFKKPDQLCPSQTKSASSVASLDWKRNSFKGDCSTIKELLVYGFNGRGLEASFLNPLHMLEKLSVSFGTIETIGDDVLQAIKNIESLDLHNNSIKTIHAGAFYSCDNLKNLDLSKNQLSTLPDDLFSRCSQLIGLKLNDNKLKIIGLDLFRFRGASKLMNLDLSENKIEKITYGALDDLKLLQMLNLNKNQLTNLPKDGMKLRNLKRLDLNNNRFTNMMKVQDSFKFMKKLSLLTIKGNQFLHHQFGKDAFCGPERVSIFFDNVDSRYDVCLDPNNHNCIGRSASITNSYRPKSQKSSLCVSTTSSSLLLTISTERNLMPTLESQPTSAKTSSTATRQSTIKNRQEVQDSNHQLSDKTSCPPCEQNKQIKYKKTLLNYIGLHQENMWLGYTIVILFSLLIIFSILFLFCYMKQKKMIYHLKEQNHYFSMLNSQAPTLDIGYHCRAPSMISSRSMPVENSHASSGAPLLRYAVSLEKVHEDCDTDKDLQSHKYSLSAEEDISPTSTRSLASGKHNLVSTSS